MATSATAPWWARPTMLSLDGPAFVLLARAALGRAWPAHFADTVLVMALVWAGYVTDRWMDARYDDDSRTWRHDASRRHAPLILGLAVLVGLLAALTGAQLAALWSGVLSWGGLWLLLGVGAIFCGRWLRLGWFVRALCVAGLMAAFVGWGEAWSRMSLACVAVLAFANLAAIRRAERPQERGMGWLLGLATGTALIFALSRPDALTLTVAAATGLLGMLGAGSGQHAERRRAIIDAVTFLALGAAALVA